MTEATILARSFLRVAWMAHGLKVQRIIEQPLIIPMRHNVVCFAGERELPRLQALSAEGLHG